MSTLKKALNESASMRWGMMVLVSFTMATNYYFYDALSPLKDLMQMHLGFTSADYGFFVSAYSFPNVFLLMAVIGGVIVDKLGIRTGGSAFIFIQVVGAFLTAYGSTDYYNSGGFGYGLMSSFLVSVSPALKMTSLGFFFFGLGAEAGIVAISKAIVKWFKGKELALALGLNLAFARLGMGAAFIISPRLVTEANWTIPIWFGSMLLVIGFLAFLVYAVYDLKFDRHTKASGEMLPTEKFRLSDIGNLVVNRSFIYITLLCLTFYSAIFPFSKFAPDLMINQYGVSRQLAGTISSILPFGTLVFTPLFAWICDYRGKSATLMIYGSLLLLVVFFMFTIEFINPFIPVFLLGVSFALIPAAMWPSVAKIVNTGKIGTAYGVMFTIQNIGLWIFPILIGIVLERSNPGVAEIITAGGDAVYDYTNPILMLAGLGIAGVVFALLLKHDDKTSGYDLEKPNKQS